MKGQAMPLKYLHDHFPFRHHWREAIEFDDVRSFEFKTTSQPRHRRALEDIEDKTIRRITISVTDEDGTILDIIKREIADDVDKIQFRAMRMCYDMGNEDGELIIGMPRQPTTK